MGIRRSLNLRAMGVVRRGVSPRAMGTVRRSGNNREEAEVTLEM